MATEEEKAALEELQAEAQKLGLYPEPSPVRARSPLAELRCAWALRELDQLSNNATTAKLEAIKAGHLTVGDGEVDALIRAHAMKPIGQCHTCGRRAPLIPEGDQHYVCAWGCQRTDPRPISPEELSEANERINQLTRLLEKVKRVADDGVSACFDGAGTDMRQVFNALEKVSDMLVQIELPPDTEPEMREFTKEDFEHSLRGIDRARMKRGEFQPGDVEKIRKFLRLSFGEWEQALGVPPSHIELALHGGANGGPISMTMRRLLALAIREPGAFRRALVRP